MAMLTWPSAPASLDVNWAAVSEPLPGWTTVAAPPSEKSLVPPVFRAKDGPMMANEQQRVRAENSARAAAPPVRLPLRRGPADLSLRSLRTTLLPSAQPPAQEIQTQKTPGGCGVGLEAGIEGSHTHDLSIATMESAVALIGQDPEPRSLDPKASQDGRVTPEAAIREIGLELDRRMDRRRGPGQWLDEHMMRWAGERADVRAAIFRFIDVAPACHTLEE